MRRWACGPESVDREGDKVFAQGDGAGMKEDAAKEPFAKSVAQAGQAFVVVGGDAVRQFDCHADDLAGTVFQNQIDFVAALGAVMVGGNAFGGPGDLFANFRGDE